MEMLDFYESEPGRRYSGTIVYYGQELQFIKEYPTGLPEGDDLATQLFNLPLERNLEIIDRNGRIQDPALQIMVEMAILHQIRKRSC